MELPLDRFLNLTYYVIIQNADQDKRKQIDRDLGLGEPVNRAWRGTVRTTRRRKTRRTPPSWWRGGSSNLDAARQLGFNVGQVN